MRVRLSKATFELTDRWAIASGSLEASSRSVVGVYAIHTATGLQIHMRDYPLVGDARALLARLEAQSWGAPPIDVASRTSGNIEIVAGTFALKGMDGLDRVREWFASDGVLGFNAAFPHSHDVAPEVLRDAEAIIGTLELDVAGGWPS